MGSGVSRSRRKRSTVAVTDTRSEDTGLDMHPPGAVDNAANEASSSSGTNSSPLRLREDVTNNDDNEKVVESSEHNDQPNYRQFGSSSYIDPNSPDVRSGISGEIESTSDLVYSPDQREELMMLMLHSAHAAKQQKQQPQQRSSAALDGSPDRVHGTGADALTAGMHEIGEDDDDRSGVLDGEDVDENEGLFAAETAEMFAHTAMSLGMDDKDLLFNLMYFNEGGFGEEGGGMVDGHAPIPSFGAIMSSVQQEAVALHSENNTPYKLKPASETAIAGLQRSLFSRQDLLQHKSMKHQEKNTDYTTAGSTAPASMQSSSSSSDEHDAVSTAIADAKHSASGPSSSSSRSDVKGQSEKSSDNYNGTESELRADETECSVCMDQLEEGCEILRIPQCGHYFHEDCLLRWIKLQSWCPVCRVPVGEQAAADVGDGKDDPFSPPSAAADPNTSTTAHVHVGSPALLDGTADAKDSIINPKADASYKAFVDDEHSFTTSPAKKLSFDMLGSSNGAGAAAGSEAEEQTVTADVDEQDCNSPGPGPAGYKHNSFSESTAAVGAAAKLDGEAAAGSSRNDYKADGRMLPMTATAAAAAGAK